MLFKSLLDRRLPRIGSRISFRICKLAEKCILLASIDFKLLNIKVDNFMGLFSKDFSLIFHNVFTHLFSQLFHKILYLLF